MALQAILSQRPAPYSRMPPLTVTIVAIKEQVKVTAWSFGDEVSATASRNNSIVAFTDGHSVAKFTMLSQFKDRVKEGQTYIMRGYGLLGQSPPFHLFISQSTMLFRTAPMAITPEREEQARCLLFPPSLAVRLRELPHHGLVTVEGKVVEVAACKKMELAKETIPLRTIKLEQDGVVIRCSLWRDAALLNFQLGQSVKISHLTGCSNTTFGYALQSTNFTELQDASEAQWETVEVVGIMDGEDGQRKLLLQDERVLEIPRRMWEEHSGGGELESVPYTIRVKVEGGSHIISVAAN